MSTLVRRELRLFRASLLANFATFDRVCRSRAAQEASQNFCRATTGAPRKSGAKALERLLPPHAVVEYREVKGRTPIMVFSIVRATEAFYVAPSDGDEAQAGVGVYSLTIARIDRQPRFQLAHTGLFASDHAMGRALERSSVNPTTLLLDAYRRLMTLPTEVLKKPSFLLPAGDGAFWAASEDGQNGQGVACRFVRARSFLHRDMIFDDQEREMGRLNAPGERIGERAMLPEELR